MQITDRLTLLNGDCLAVMRDMPDASVDAVVCDPPYGLSAEPDMAEVMRHWLAGDDYVHTGSGFMGSGSTGKACHNEGFRFVGVERDPDYYAMAVARIWDHVST